MCVVWVVGTCSSTAWDEPSARSSFPIFFLGGILWVFSRAHKRWAPILGFSSQGLSNSIKSREQMKSKREICGMVWKVVSTSFFRPQRGARAGLFIVGDQRSHYNALNAPNHLPCQ
jgi:hypothetical protein